MFYSTPVPNDLSPRTLAEARLVDLLARLCRDAAKESPGQIDAMINQARPLLSDDLVSDPCGDM